MSPTNVRRWIAAACLFLVCGAAAAYVEIGNSPSLEKVLSLLAVLSFLLGLALTPRLLFGAVTLKSGKSPLFAKFPGSLALGLVGFAVFFGASLIARHL